MTWNKFNFMEHWKKIRVEGFYPNQLIDQCIKNGIDLKRIRWINQVEITVTISGKDFNKLKKLAKSRYKITLLEQGGCKLFFHRVWIRKTTLVGLLFFVALIVYQSLFIAEIRINGYEELSEPELRQCMEDSGLYEGCRKKVDISKVKRDMYKTFDQLSWVSVRFNGRMAEVKIVEGAGKPKIKVKDEKPCNIVADQSGYIKKIIPTEGIRSVEDNTYVEKGDILIKGKIPLNSTAFGTPDEKKTNTYVHAQGIVEANIPYHMVYYTERYQRIKTKTGRSFFGISINGKNIVGKMNHYPVSQRTSHNLINIVKPIPIKIDLIQVNELTLKRRELDKKSVEKAVNAQIRQFVKENLDNKAEISNKSLNFTLEKNIMEISVTIEALQQIGIEEEIVFGKAKNDHGKLKKDGDK
ncbi:MAG: sporulation protein YqfD [Anaerovoracaceae bacterium]